MSNNKEPRPRRTFSPELKSKSLISIEVAKENAILSENMILQAHSLINGSPRLITVVPLKKKITVLQKIPNFLGFARKSSSLRWRTIF
ncbi:MAG: hypothetical protein PWP53_2073 [Lacrimispora sp.]|jgi:hypothetical protein|nr:hypothetical protein [Lacrimispora sp.]